MTNPNYPYGAPPPGYAQAPAGYPQHAQHPQAPAAQVPANPNLERIRLTVKRLAYIKSECHQAVHPTVIRDRLKDVIEVLEYLLAGQISQANPNVMPGFPAGALEDPTKTRVEFFGGPAPTPPPRGAPVVSGDVHFIPGPPPGSPGAVGGQTVEFFGGPQGDPSQGGQRVEYYGGPPQPAAPALPPAPAPSYAPPAAAAPPPNPFAPVAPPPSPVSNQPAQIVAPPPTLTTEAGHPVAPSPPVLAVPPAPPVAAYPTMTPEEALEAARRVLPIAEVVPVTPQGMPNGTP